MAETDKMPIEDFLKWLCMKRRIEVDGKIKEKSFRFGRSIWIIGRHSDFAEAAMVRKEVVSEMMKRLEEDNYIRYVGLWTYELTEKGLNNIGSKLPTKDIPSDYGDYVRMEKKR